ncbi:MAG: DUF262 domain-containing protein, partial [Alphaproteobacteria bacterium]|nr:DUF262 domain-containing protein [Alphaproteobacteria bacterium]
MSYETALKIVDIVDGINKKYLLPAIQRELVWKPEQIEMLFDSLMRDYPIGSFLFWSVENKRVKDFKFYEFIREYHEKTNKHNAKANINGRQNITAILDGQQRLTSLFIGLKGSYSYKTYRMRADNPRAYTERKLYINLVREAKDNSGKKYNFQFLTEDEANIKDTDNYWFCVGEILNFKEYSDITNYLIANITYNDDYNYNKQQGLLSNRILSRLYEVVHVKGIISYYQEKSQELDKVLNIFIRINSGGTELSYSDLLLSIATAQWKEKDARAEIIKITDEINDIGDGFNFSKDFILKSCLVLNDFKNIAFKVDNFNNKNMAKIEKNWDSITSSIRQAVQLVSSFGYNKQTLKSNNAVIPIAYFLYNNELTDSFVSSTKNAKDRKNIKRWLDLSLIKRVFGGQSDNILKKIRKIIVSKR